MLTRVNKADKLLEEVKEGMHVVMISPLNDRMFYLYNSEESYTKFNLEVVIASKTTENSFFYDELSCRLILNTWMDMKATRVRIYQTEQEARQCVELWKSILFKED